MILEATDPSIAVIGYTLSLGEQGRGLASEALALLLQTLADHQGSRRVKAVTDVRNGASLRLLHRPGFDEVETRPKDELHKGQWYGVVKCNWLFVEDGMGSD